jgi:formate dehydrogenase major subunit
VADELVELRARYGGNAITANASAKATNEDNYVFQKLIRAL